MIINSRNNHVFKGHKALLGGKFVTYGELEFQTRYEIFDKSESFDWGHSGSGAQQLSFSILCQLTNEEFARQNHTNFTNDIVRHLNSRDWILTASDAIKWIKDNTDEVEEETKVLQNQKISKKKKENVVKKVCKELGITQKNLANILEVPEGTVSSWAVKNEIPRLGKKAIEFYIEKQRNQQIVDSYKSFVTLLNAS